MAAHDSSVPVQSIVSGKLRRYHTIPLWQQLLMLRTVLLPNIFDSLKIVIGVIQSFVKLIIWRPDVVFTKGGFVCLPVGFSAHLLRIPLVIHDSDAHPGLTNRVLARWARQIATGAPTEYYPYATSKTHYVGIPLVANLEPLSEEAQQNARQALGFDKHAPLVMITGGGLGALRINNAAAAILPSLLQRNISVMLVSGSKQFNELQAKLRDYSDNDNFQLREYISSGFQAALASADLVVSRAGATTLLELAALAKPTIVIPNARLTGGHQLKNAQAYQERGAVEVIGDDDIEREPALLQTAILNLLENDDKRLQLGQAIHHMAKPDAARDMAKLILEAANK